MNKFSFIYLLIFTFSCGAPQIHIKKSDHFDGEEFFNPKSPFTKKSYWQILKWWLDGKKKKWPKWVEISQQQVKEKRVKKNVLTITFVNHSTFLIQMDGVNILTDPIWSQRASPFSWIGPKRVKRPGIKFKDLPPIDIVLVSHNHYDHMDTPTLKKLIERDQPKILFGIGNSYYLSDSKHQDLLIELDWHQSFSFKGITFVFLPVRHWSRRTLSDINKALWGGFAIISQYNKKLYFAGDTGFGEHFKDASKIYKYFDVAMLPIGGYSPRWFMNQAHINPEEAVLAHKDLKAKISIGMHYGTFSLTNEGIDDPLKDLQKAKEKYQITEEFITLENGQSFTY